MYKERVAEVLSKQGDECGVEGRERREWTRAETRDSASTETTASEGGGGEGRRGKRASKDWVNGAQCQK